jgi:predicted ATPase
MVELPTGTVTFLFTDIEGSTRLLVELGDRYAGALAEYRRVLREVFNRHNGVEVDTQGDAFFVAFATASDAVAAAQEAVAGDIPVRIGVHTGEPEIGEEGYVGLDVHRAARICAAAHGGQVLVSAATARLVDARLRDLGEHRLKDLDAPVGLLQLGDDDFPPVRSLRQTNLPVPSTSFLGRAEELSEVLALLVREDVRVLTLTGPGGIGKTRLALELARSLLSDFAQGVWFVDLAAVRDSALVLPAIGATIGATDDLVSRVADREMLLVLDNLEQVIEAGPGLASLVLACPRLRLILTSREALHIAAEQEYPVQPLVEQEAVSFFLARARAVDPAFEDNSVVVEICRRLDHLPLALELAAARTKVLSAERILARLEGRLALLTSGRRDAPARHRTLLATIEWSHELLSDEEKRLYARLAVFAGGWTLEAAEQVCNAKLDTLASLIEKNLVRYEEDRYSMLETVREYAFNRLEALGDQGTLRRRHAEYVVAIGESVDEAVGSMREVGLLHLTAELDNLRTAMAWSLEMDIELGLRLAWVAVHFQPAASELRSWLDDAMTRGVAAPALQRARALHMAGFLATRTDEPDRAAACFKRALPLYREIGHEQGVARVQVGLGLAAWIQGDADTARSLYESSLAMYRRLDDADGEWIVANNLGELERTEANYDRAADLLRRAVTLATHNDDTMAAAMSLHGLGDVALDRGDLDQARTDYRESIRRVRPLAGAGLTICCCLAGLASVAARKGQAASSGRLWGAVEIREERLGAPLPLQDRVRYRRPLEAHDQDDLAANVAAGRALPLDDALDLALSAD